MSNPDELKFAKSHEWISPQGVVGISDHAQKEITDVVFVDLPKVGRDVKAGEACAVVESVKAAFDIYAPIAGKISKINEEVSKNPEIVNKSPYGEGWLFQIEKSGNGEPQLMSHTEYVEFVKTEANH